MPNNGSDKFGEKLRAGGSREVMKASIAEAGSALAPARNNAYVAAYADPEYAAYIAAKHEAAARARAEAGAEAQVIGHQLVEATPTETQPVVTPSADNILPFRQPEAAAGANPQNVTDALAAVYGIFDSPNVAADAETDILGRAA